MNSRGLISLALSLLMSAVALVALPGTVTTAYAAATPPCTVSYTKPAGTINPHTGAPDGHQFNAWALEVPDGRVVTDISFSIDVSHPDAANLQIHLLGRNFNGDILGPTLQALNRGSGASGTIEGTYHFDQESTPTKLTGASPDPGLYAPTNNEAPLEGVIAQGRWDLWILNYGPYTGTLRSWTLTLTYATCDTDGDGVEEKVDNCPSAVNSDQANRDSDALGDACDLDLDGDSLGNDADGCPLVATTTRTGCPTATRTAKLTYVKKKHRLAGVVGSSAPGCRADAKVTLLRKKPGRDTKLLVSTTSSKGRFRVKAPVAAGRYYVTVAKSYATGEAECGSARSKAAQVSARSALVVRSAAGPDTDGDGLMDASDGCPSVASSNPTGCPTVSRRARLRYLGGNNRLQATITSSVTACSARARIKLWRELSGADTRLQVATAYASGRFRFKVPSGARYYVTVSSSYAPGSAECAEATSPTVVVPRR